jgi:hypothetical protein
VPLSIQDIALPDLPKGNSTYRVVWFGGVLPRSQFERRIEVGLEREGAGDQTYKKIVTGVGALPLLPLGSRWRRQVRIEDPPSTASQYREFTIELDTSQPHSITSVGAIRSISTRAPNGNSQDLRIHPITQKQYTFKTLFPMASETLLLECPGVWKGNPITVIVPMPVIVQFYWGSSTSLMREVFEDTWVADPPDFSRVMDPERSSFQEDQGVARIALRPRLLTTDAAMVARAWLAPQALSALRSIALSVTAHEANRQPMTEQRPFYGLRTSFPFHGHTTLRLYGNLQTNRHAGARLLVLRILRCTYPFPFHRVEVIGRPERTGLGPVVGVGGDPVPEHRLYRFRQNRRIARPIQAVTDESATNEVVGLRLEELVERFEDLTGKIHRPRVDTSAGSVEVIHQSMASGSKFSLAGSEWVAPTPPLDAGFSEAVVLVLPVPKEEQLPPRQIDPFRDDFPFLLEVADRLREASVTVRQSKWFRSQKDIQPEVNLRHGSEFELDIDGRPASYFPDPSTPIESAFDWLYTDKMRTDRRTCMVVEIRLIEKFFYVFETTRKEEELKRYYPRMFVWDPRYMRLTDIQIDDVLEEAVKNHLERAWMGRTSLPDLWRTFFRHNTFNAHVCAETILRLTLKKACGFDQEQDYLIRVPRKP